MASEAFLRRNPRFREAERKSRGPREKKPNVRVRNLDEFHFKNQGYSSEEAKQMAAEAADSGMRTGFGGRGIQSLNRRTQPRRETRAPAGPTDDQRRWAQKFRESSMPRKPAPVSGGGGSLLGAAARTFKSAVGVPSSPTPAPEKPLNFSRSAMVEGAKRSGDFAKTREDFNKQSAAAQTGMRMNDRGGMDPLNKTTAGADGLTDYAREKFGPAVEDIRARRDFATGKSTTTSGTEGMVKQDGGARPTQAQDFRREITSKYGSGSNVARAPGQAGGSMVDPLTGKPVSMTGALAQQSAVQDTKVGTSGDGYFDPKKIRQGMQQRRGRV